MAFVNNNIACVLAASVSSKASSIPTSVSGGWGCATVSTWSLANLAHLSQLGELEHVCFSVDRG